MITSHLSGGSQQKVHNIQTFQAFRNATIVCTSEKSEHPFSLYALDNPETFERLQLRKHRNFIFYSARNTASIHKNNLGQPALPRLQKNPNTESVTGEDPASGLPILQTLNKQNIANHQNEGFAPQPRGIQKENKNAVNL